MSILGCKSKDPNSDECCIKQNPNPRSLWVVCGLVATSCLTLATPWTLACQASCPWDSPGKNTGVICLFLLSGIFLTQKSSPPRSPALQADSLPTELQGKPIRIYRIGQKVYLGFFVPSEKGTCSPVVNASPSSARGVGLIPGQGGPDLVGQKTPQNKNRSNTVTTQYFKKWST